MRPVRLALILSDDSGVLPNRGKWRNQNTLCLAHSETTSYFWTTIIQNISVMHTPILSSRFTRSVKRFSRSHCEPNRTTESEISVTPGCRTKASKILFYIIATQNLPFPTTTPTLTIRYLCVCSNLLGKRAGLKETFAGHIINNA